MAIYIRKESIALILVIIFVFTTVTACVYSPGQNSTPVTSGFTAQQKEVARQVLVKDKLVSNLSGIGEPESFGAGFNNSRTLAILPVFQNNSQYVSNAFIVDLDRNVTVARVNCGITNLSFERVKNIANLTIGAPVVSDDFWDNDTKQFTINIDSFEDMAPGYIGWSGRFISISVSDNVQIPHKMSVVIDDSASRVISVSDVYYGVYSQFSPRYVLLPPGKEKYFEIIANTFDRPDKYPYMWMTRVKLVPAELKVYPIIIDEDNFNRITKGTPANALEYRDFVTDGLQRYGGDRPVGSGWTANISLNHDAKIYLILKSAETDKDIQAEVNIYPDREMGNIIHEVWLRETNASTSG